MRGMFEVVIPQVDERFTDVDTSPAEEQFRPEIGSRGSARIGDR